MSFPKMQSKFTSFSHFFVLLYMCSNRGHVFCYSCAFSQIFSLIITIFYYSLCFLASKLGAFSNFKPTKTELFTICTVFSSSNCTFPGARTFIFRDADRIFPPLPGQISAAWSPYPRTSDTHVLQRRIPATMNYMHPMAQLFRKQKTDSLPEVRFLSIRFASASSAGFISFLHYAFC